MFVQLGPKYTPGSRVQSETLNNLESSSGRCVLPDICILVLESSVGDACCIIQVMGTSTDLSGVIQLLVRWIINS